MKVSRFQLKQSLPERAVMPGFLVVVSLNDKKFDLVFSEGVNKFFNPYGDMLVTYSDNVAILGYLGVSRNDTLRKQFMQVYGRYIVCVQGTFYDDSIIKASNDCFAEMIIQTYLSKPEQLNCFNGYYSGYIYSITTTQLAVFSDGLGFEKVYYRHDSDCFIASNNLYAIVSNRHLNRRVSEYALAETLVYQYPTGNKTIEDKTKLLGPSDTLLLRNGKVEIKKREAYKLGCRKKQRIEALVSKYDIHYETLKKYLNDPVALYLSKGKDARILMVMMKRHMIPFSLYNFAYGTTGALDSDDAIRLASLDNRSISVVESYESSDEIDIMLAMDSTFHTEWTSIADLAERNGIKYFTMGTAADAWSGKLTAFRKEWRINGYRDLFHELFRAVSHNQDASYNQSFSMLPSFEELEDNFISYCQTIKRDTIEDSELCWDLEYRVFRNTLSILHRCRYYGIPIHTPMDINILNCYLSLPLSLIKSQIAQASIASMDKVLASIPTIEANLPLRIEKHIRSLVLLCCNLKSMRRVREVCPKCNTKYAIQSSVLRNIVHNDSISIYNARLLQRTTNTDKFLNVAFDIMPYKNRDEHCVSRELVVDH